MYMLERFREDDLPTLHALMRDYSFATLVTQHEGVPFASHLPLIFALMRDHTERCAGI